MMPPSPVPPASPLSTNHLPSRGSSLSHGYLRLRLGPWHGRLHVRRSLLGILLLMVLMAGALFASLHGSTPLSTPSLILDTRLPRVLLALCCGAMLGMAGASLQALTRNGLADPGLLGVREGAGLALMITVLWAPATPLLLRPLIGMGGGLAVAVLTILLARSLSRLRFILIGIGVSWMVSALISMLLITTDADRMQGAMVWMLGSLTGASWQTVSLSAGCLAVGATLLILCARAGDAAQLGDALAQTLGVRRHRLSILRLVAPILLTAACVSVSGSLGFVGLVAPHLCRLSLGGGQLPLVIGSAAWGALLVLAADTAGRLALAPLQIPAGLILALLGVPVLLILLWYRRHVL